MGVTGYKDGLNWRHPLSLVRMLYTFMRLKSKRLETPKKATNPEDDSKPLSSPAFISLNSFLSLHKLSLKSTPRVLVFLIRRNSLQNLFSPSLTPTEKERNFNMQNTCAEVQRQSACGGGRIQQQRAPLKRERTRPPSRSHTHYSRDIQQRRSNNSRARCLRAAF
jgi:hypothetical protein